MNTYYISGYRIAARSDAQARFAAKKLKEAGVPTDNPRGWEEVPAEAKAEYLPEWTR